jgi:hypothetical protein
MEIDVSRVVFALTERQKDKTRMKNRILFMASPKALYDGEKYYIKKEKD